MRGLKLWMKSLASLLRCTVSGVPICRGVYIGRGVSMKGGKRIRLGVRVCIRPYAELWCCGKELSIGDGSEIGARCRLSAVNRIEIGRKVLLSPNVYITDCDHAYQNIHEAIMDQGVVDQDSCVEIGDGSYIGINSVIVGNVKIGQHSVIGANSVVTKDIPDYSVAVGTPARVIKKYNFNTECWERVL